ncbi:hypothetical protein FRX31_030080 [Thalictrum thalictroides]|uniref:Uncharacterized protein n=1 Tax=Thalictrum thalictroides TaxID=46969 RepID=A0A7J6V7E9_THATH|nr:hypothetical protein FRX31_030080 [Thalictrum thalictroides]
MNKIRQNKATIKEMKGYYGETIRDPKQIGDFIVNHFEEKFKARNIVIDNDLTGLIPMLVTEENNLMLSSMPSHEEIKHAAFTFNADRWL